MLAVVLVEPDGLGAGGDAESEAIPPGPVQPVPQLVGVLDGPPEPPQPAFANLVPPVHRSEGDLGPGPVWVTAVGGLVVSMPV